MIDNPKNRGNDLGDTRKASHIWYIFSRGIASKNDQDKTNKLRVNKVRNQGIAYKSGKNPMACKCEFNWGSWKEISRQICKLVVMKQQGDEWSGNRVHSFEFSLKILPCQ
ncbi:hypothetical protein O9G_000839 [Rozella allomycis CSF55]|uniref:Uncharacterized protein n=1 Tax=Rozella allomycis (strain CSF55) TaxID=988480 RepID=A0A075AW55_ROZAC|nr:hypothetical protein O9G_000839 [Rozella allomycis CSF55]|eukprot:EPZ32764.1 hypothetical protein O9G_000839 [Rozella allomycis CSF55]